jgi:hypothetical protein
MIGDPKVGRVYAMVGSTFIGHTPSCPLEP